LDDRHIVVQSQIDCTGIVLLGFAVAQEVGVVSAVGRARVVEKCGRWPHALTLVACVQAQRLAARVIRLRTARPIRTIYLAGTTMDTAKPALIRETFPVGPLQCNCVFSVVLRGLISLV
jgi:hypothetical protein